MSSKIDRNIWRVGMDAVVRHGNGELRKVRVDKITATQVKTSDSDRWHNSGYLGGEKLGRFGDKESFRPPYLVPLSDVLAAALATQKSLTRAVRAADVFCRERTPASAIALQEALTEYLARVPS